MTHVTLTYYTDDSFEETVEAPAEYKVCSRCHGEGKHTNPAIDGNGITQSEMHELGEEFFEDYMSGVYDITCQKCNGERVEAVIDWDQFRKQDPEIAAIVDADRQEQAEYRAMCESERRFGC